MQPTPRGCEGADQWPPGNRLGPWLQQTGKAEPRPGLGQEPPWTPGKEAQSVTGGDGQTLGLGPLTSSAVAGGSAPRDSSALTGTAALSGCRWAARAGAAWSMEAGRTLKADTPAQGPSRCALRPRSGQGGQPCAHPRRPTPAWVSSLGSHVAHAAPERDNRGTDRRVLLPGVRAQRGAGGGTRACGESGRPGTPCSQ